MTIPVSAASAIDVAAFRRDGYLLPGRQLLPQGDLQRLTAVFEEHLADRGDNLSDELDTPHFRDPRLLDFLLADTVLDIVEPLVGPDIALWTSHFISKEPVTGRGTPWHEDSAFWNGRLSAYDRIVTVWLALGPSTRANGCMRVVPGTHHHGFSDYVAADPARQTFDKQIADVAEDEAVYFELAPGEFSLHDGRIVHGAEPNTSPVRRTGYTMRYFPASVRMLPVPRNDGHRLWLARGHDTAGNRYVNA
jgi:ectoine hydroxylase-related dioxygenase (phytanoyl-CoA dioxygenase family)